jgi:hypothetical protein
MTYEFSSRKLFGLGKQRGRPSKPTNQFRRSAAEPSRSLLRLPIRYNGERDRVWTIKELSEKAAQ